MSKLFEHACFISFPRDAGKASTFADHFFDELVEQVAAIDKTLSLFKYDRLEQRRRGDSWNLWIQRELCQSAMMIAVCAPSYFTGSAGCMSEFSGMEALIVARTNALAAAGATPTDWIIGTRIKDRVPMPRLDPYRVVDFLDCCASPDRVRRVRKHRETVELLAYDIWNHWQHVQDGQRSAALSAANICQAFAMPGAKLDPADPFPHAGGVR